MDKTRFCVGYSRAYWVIIFDPDKPLLLIYLNNQEYITSVKSISSKEKKILPMLILYKIYILEK